MVVAASVSCICLWAVPSSCWQCQLFCLVQTQGESPIYVPVSAQSGVLILLQSQKLAA